MASTQMNKNLAEHILGMTGIYDATALRKAYRKLAKENHPDMVAARGGDARAAEDRMSEINSAYDYINGMFADCGYETLTATPEAPAAEPKAAPAGTSSGAAAAAAQPTPEPETANTDAAWTAFWEEWDARAAANRAAAAAGPEPEPEAEPAEDFSFRTAEKEAAAHKAEAGARNATAPAWYRVAKSLLGLDWVWRVALFLIALKLYSSIGGFGASIDMDIASQFPPEFIAIVIGVYLASGLNLVFGFLTKPLAKAVKWGLGKFAIRRGIAL